MASPGFLSALNLGTLVVVLIIIGIALALFLRKRSNRHPLAGMQERNVAKDLYANRSASDYSTKRDV